MLGTVPGAGVDLSCRIEGRGHAVVVVHDVGSSMADSAQLAAPLAKSCRIVTYDRRGYGESGAPEPYAATTAAEQGEDLGALVHATGADEPLAIGVGFGALAVLDRLTREPGQLGAAILVDPPAYAFVPEATTALSERLAALESAVEDAGAPAGVAQWLGPDTPPQRLERARQDQRAVFADVAGLASLDAGRAGLKAIGVPVTIVTGPASRPEDVAAADALAALIPGCGRRTDGDVAAGALPLVT